MPASREPLSFLPCKLDKLAKVPCERYIHRLLQIGPSHLDLLPDKLCEAQIQYPVYEPPATACPIYTPIPTYINSMHRAYTQFQFNCKTCC